MSLQLRANSRVVFEVVTQVPATLAPIPNLPVYLDRIDQLTAAPIQVALGSTDSKGVALLDTISPAAPGQYRYRARTTGLAGKYRADVSANLVVEVV